MTRAALITGANRGLGFETARQLIARGWDVWVSARSAAKAQAAVAALGVGRPLALDVTDAASVAEAFATVAREGGLDCLINNAGGDYDTDQRAAEADLDRVRATFEMNFFGAWSCAREAAPLLVRHDHSVIVNVSSGAGSITRMEAAPPGYAASKAALNALTRILAAELKPRGVLVNAICPGWVATDLGGGGRPVAEGAAGIVWGAMLGPDGPTGGFFRDGQPIAW